MTLTESKFIQFRDYSCLFVAKLNICMQQKKYIICIICYSLYEKKKYNYTLSFFVNDVFFFFVF